MRALFTLCAPCSSLRSAVLEPSLQRRSSCHNVSFFGQSVLCPADELLANPRVPRQRDVLQDCLAREQHAHQHSVVKHADALEAR